MAFRSTTLSSRTNIYDFISGLISAMSKFFVLKAWTRKSNKSASGKFAFVTETLANYIAQRECRRWIPATIRSVIFSLLLRISFDPTEINPRCTSLNLNHFKLLEDVNKLLIFCFFQQKDYQESFERSCPQRNDLSGCFICLIEVCMGVFLRASVSVCVCECV